MEAFIVTSHVDHDAIRIERSIAHTRLTLDPRSNVAIAGKPEDQGRSPIRIVELWDMDTHAAHFAIRPGDARDADCGSTWNVACRKRRTTTSRTILAWGLRRNSVIGIRWHISHE